jgi:hypothetical protein
MFSVIPRTISPFSGAPATGRHQKRHTSFPGNLFDLLEAFPDIPEFGRFLVGMADMEPVKVAIQGRVLLP